MPIKKLDAKNLGLNEDWVGNNIAITCPHCNKVFIVSDSRVHGRPDSRGNRKCPNCQKTTGKVKGGAKSEGEASIEW